MKIEVAKQFSIEIARLNPDKIFVFGDDLVHQGTGGSACIRHEPNAFGIPIRRYPHLRNDAFFADRPDEDSMMTEALRALFLLGKHHVLVFPEDGICPASAKMKQKSPRLYAKLIHILSSHFGVEVQPHQ
ncbi:hypothetical protein P5704_025990 (plasmid) [Pseudomonas sp. FeN3W]|nr:hypothetical protein P5704_025990 [Pseudomonas sp. FeN3W]